MLRVVEAILILSPVIYGLSLYGWSLQPMITPSYTPPKMSFSVGEVKPAYLEGVMVIYVSIANEGEVPVTVVDFKAPIIYKEERIGEALLKSPVNLPAGENATLIIVADIENATPLIKGMMQGDGSLELPGRVKVDVMGVTAEAPMNITVSTRKLVEASGGR